MKKISYILGMMAAGGALGAAADASASTTVVLNLPLSSDASLTNITLAGAIDPQYQYGSFANIPGIGTGVDDSGIITYLYNYIPPSRSLSAIRQIASSTTKNDIGLVVGESQGAAPLTLQEWVACGSSCYKTNPGFPVAGIVSGPDANPTGGNEYFYLLFTNTNVVTSPDDLFFGYATIGSPGSETRPPPRGGSHGVLGQVDPTTLVSITYSAVPEPESWALMMAGVGLAGGTLRANRRRRAATVAA